MNYKDEAERLASWLEKQDRPEDYRFEDIAALLRSMAAQLEALRTENAKMSADAKTAWLIEYTLPHCPPSWAMLRRSNCFDSTSDANKATRFSRREDAQAVLDQLTGMEKLPVISENVSHYFKVTEHMWLDAIKKKLGEQHAD